MVFDALVDGMMIGRDGQRDQGSSGDSEKELDLGVSAAEYGGR